MFGVSDLIIGLIAILQFARAGCYRRSALKDHQLPSAMLWALTFNILAVLSVPALLGGVQIDYVALWRDAGMMTALTMMLALLPTAILVQ